tara:strand:+ start:1103 stop:1252 length:150 start_codon:yes stop_codon:yes gene_type:complete
MKDKLRPIWEWLVSVAFPLVMLLLSLMLGFFAAKALIWTFELENYFGPL